MITRALFALSVLLLFAPDAAHSCSRRGPGPTDRQLFDNASSVFVARVVETKLSRFPRSQCEDEGMNPNECYYVEATFELVESLKGRVSNRGKVSDLVFGPGNCSLGLMAGWYYVFYTQADHNFVPFIDGSFVLNSTIDNRERGIIQRLKEAPHPRPPESGG